MNFDDETLGRYLDGELDDAIRRDVDADIATDPNLAAWLRVQVAVRTRLRGALGELPAEPIPRRLLEAVRGREGGTRLLHRVAIRRLSVRTFQRSWLAAAAALVVVLLSLPGHPFRIDAIPNVIARDGQEYAAGELAHSLQTRLSSEQPARSRVRVTLSFIARSGQYCRVFAAPWRGTAVDGLACREPDGWRVEATKGGATGRGDDDSAESYRQAASGLSPALLAAVAERMQGEPLDGPAEVRARARGWRAPASP